MGGAGVLWVTRGCQSPATALVQPETSSLAPRKHLLRSAEGEEHRSPSLAGSTVTMKGSSELPLASVRCQPLGGRLAEGQTVALRSVSGDREESPFIPSEVTS